MQKTYVLCYVKVYVLCYMEVYVLSYVKVYVLCYVEGYVMINVVQRARRLTRWISTIKPFSELWFCQL